MTDTRQSSEENSGSNVNENNGRINGNNDHKSSRSHSGVSQLDQSILISGSGNRNQLKGRGSNQELESSNKGTTSTMTKPVVTSSSSSSFPSSGFDLKKILTLTPQSSSTHHQPKRGNIDGSSSSIGDSSSDLGIDSKTKSSTTIPTVQTPYLMTTPSLVQSLQPASTTQQPSITTPRIGFSSSSILSSSKTSLKTSNNNTSSNNSSGKEWVGGWKQEGRHFSRREKH